VVGKSGKSGGGAVVEGGNRKNQNSLSSLSLSSPSPLSSFSLLPPNQPPWPEPSPPCTRLRTLLFVSLSCCLRPNRELNSHRNNWRQNPCDLTTQGGLPLPFTTSPPPKQPSGNIRCIYNVSNGGGDSGKDPLYTLFASGNEFPSCYLTSCTRGRKL